LGYALNLAVGAFVTGCLYCVVGLGVILVYKSSSIFNFAHPGFMVLLSFMMWQLLIGWNLPLWLTLLLLVVFALILAAIMQGGLLQPLMGQPLLTAVMLTMAVYYALMSLSAMIWPGGGRYYPELFAGGKLMVGPVVLSYGAMATAGVCALATIGVVAFFRFSKTGLVLRGMSEDQNLARSEGINIGRMLILVWFICILLATVAGASFAYNRSLFVEAISTFGFKSLPIAMLAGLESIYGGIIAAFIIAVAEGIGTGYLDPYVGGGLAELLPYIIMLVVLLFRPYGLFGYKRIERV
jgi:branched-chain amino acid transport system permease protein